MSQTIQLPEILNPGTQSGGWMVLMYNNDHTMMDEVIEILMRATGCDMQEAYIEMWEAHTFGKASVHFSSKEECDDAAATISSVGIKTEVTLEWPE
ncbi:MAG: ATP-dependent Clp protease adaptor ClpS [Chlorobia bacterium]|nr:ATP-dependent Clp protease adaptor ClpS [Fimbriimonadaceae bacterium]